MTTKERVIRLVETLSESDLLVAERLLRGLSLPPEVESTAPPMTEEERRAKAHANLGILAHTHTSVDQFHAHKREEVELEEERYRRRHPEEP